MSDNTSAEEFECVVGDTLLSDQPASTLLGDGGSCVNTTAGEEVVTPTAACKEASRGWRRVVQANNENRAEGGINISTCQPVPPGIILKKKARSVSLLHPDGV